jgi:hypothetical protein
LISSQVIATIILSDAQSLSKLESTTFVNQFIAIIKAIFDKLECQTSFPLKVFITSVFVLFVQFFASHIINGLFKFNQKGLLILFFKTKSICSSLDCFISETSNHLIELNNFFKNSSNCFHFSCDNQLLVLVFSLFIFSNSSNNSLKLNHLFETKNDKFNSFNNLFNFAFSNSSFFD